MSSLATPTIESNLPTVTDNPQAAVVIYDGECNFCRAQVAKLARWDGTGKRLAFLSLHDAEIARRWPELTHDMLMEQMYLVDTDGKKYAGAECFRYLSRKLPKLWWLAPMLHMPFTMPLWQWGYRQVAKRRYRLMGKKQACQGGTCELHYR